MDYIINELDTQARRYEVRGQNTDSANIRKIKMDYLLMLTIAAVWDLKSAAMSQNDKISVLSRLQRPETGKLIQLIQSGFSLDESIVQIFDLYKISRNIHFGHSTYDEFQAQRVKSECEDCWDSLLRISATTDSDSELIKHIYQEDNDFYYISWISPEGLIMADQFGSNGSKTQREDIPLLTMKSRLKNQTNEIKEGDLFLAVDDYYIKVSPFIKYTEDKRLFMMLMDVETKPLAFKMAYIFRTNYANESEIYLDEFPIELKNYYPDNAKGLGKNGVSINHFSQYDLFTQEYYKEIHQEAISQIDQFVAGNMSYGAVHGIAGVGKTSAVFMWMNRLLDNKDGILDSIRMRFNLRRILFLSAKTKIFSRDVKSNLSNFDDIASDVSNYHDVIESIYAAFHQQEKKGVTFEDKVDYIRNYSNQSQGVLIIIDDYESLPSSSRKAIQELKDHLSPEAIKILITTRFISMESKEITVKILDEDDCAKMTDHIFGSKGWRKDISSREMHQFTGGRPLLIWYAKAYFQIGQLSSKKLKRHFSGPAEGLDSYLFDNFVQCFRNKFTHNFLLMVTRYYKLHQTLQISKKIILFLCLEQVRNYKVEDEEFYFAELSDLKLITINQSTNYIDFSPLMTFMDQSTKNQEAREQALIDGLKILNQLDEVNNSGLYAVIDAAEYLENEAKCRILGRLMEFAQSDEDIKIISLKKLFAASIDKMKLYEDNTYLFQNNSILIKEMLNYLISDCYIESVKYEVVRDFLKSISVTIDKRDDMEILAYAAIELADRLLQVLFEKRFDELITNIELETKSRFLRTVVLKLLNRIDNESEKKRIYIDRINVRLDDISIYTNISKV